MIKRWLWDLFTWMVILFILLVIGTIMRIGEWWDPYGQYLKKMGKLNLGEGMEADPTPRELRKKKKRW